MTLEAIEIAPKKKNLYAHARSKRTSDDLLVAQASICTLSHDNLRLANVQFFSFLKNKVKYHRSNRGTFHGERASAFDAALQEFTQLLQDVDD